VNEPDGLVERKTATMRTLTDYDVAFAGWTDSLGAVP
jgi:hypothetical protein